MQQRLLTRRNDNDNTTGDALLSAYDYSTSDIMRILDPNRTNDVATVRANLNYYMRRFKGDAEYTRFFSEIRDILVEKGVLGQSDGAVADAMAIGKALEASSYTLVELAETLGHSASPKPDLSALMREHQSYVRRLAPDAGDDDEERVNKARVRKFFDEAYERLLIELYPTKAVTAEAAIAAAGSESLAEAAAINQNRHERAGATGARPPPPPPPPTTSSQVAPQMQSGAQMQLVAQPMEEAEVNARTVGAPRSAKKTRKYTINFDTRFRPHYFDKARSDLTTSSEINFSLDERLRNVRRISLASLEFPNSSYAVSSTLKSNIFYVQVTKNMYQTRENGDFIDAADTDPRVALLPSESDTHKYLDHMGVEHEVSGGAVGVYRVTMMSGNYNRDMLVNAVNIALRTCDISSGLSAIILESNSAYHKLVMRNIDLLSSDATQASSILYTNQTVVRNGVTHFGANPLGGLLANKNYDFSFNLFFDIYEELDMSGNYDLRKKLPNRPLYFNAGWIFGFRKNRYVYHDDYNMLTPDVVDSDKTTYTSGDRSYFPGYNAEAPYDINSMRYFYVCLTDFVTNGTNHFIQALRDPNTGMQSMYGLPSDVIARIVNNGPKLHYTFFDRSDFINKSREYDMPVTLQNFRLRIVDEYGRVLDLNQMDWSAAIEVECELD